MAQGSTILVGLIGAGIGASLSPALHEQEARALGLRCRYERFDLDELRVAPEQIGEVLVAARDRGLRGVNVTHPGKQLVVDHLDELSAEAAALGAVNTVVFADDRMVGHNTDWPGFAEGFSRGLPDVATDRVVLVGAGGAGGAVAHALLELGSGHVAVVDTDRAQADGLVALLHARYGEHRADVAALDDALPGADGLVHATPTGMAAHPGSAIDAERLDPAQWVADVVYRPLETELLRTARARGCRTLNGGRMAVFQAADAFALFTGVRPDRERMLRHFARLTEQPQPV